ncbi:MAG: hypothetical protein A2020_15675 [Lentisphaerae bacterium GWF2_45_14]|nr:MAG: hypothetical protein A2020_15675 [Lentisphaerae bacterium GWF2_45_14]
MKKPQANKKCYHTGIFINERRKRMKQYFKQAEITPKQALAGDSVCISMRLVIGFDFISEKARLVFDLPGTLKFSRPTCFLQSEDGFVEVYCSNPDVVYSKKIWDIEKGVFIEKGPQAGNGGRAQRFFILDIEEGQLAENDEIEVRWGDTVYGFGTGTKVASVITFPDYKAIVDVRYFIDREKSLPDWGRDFKGYRRPTPDWETPLEMALLPREPETFRQIRKFGKSYLQLRDRFYNICAVNDPAPFVKEKISAKKNEAGVFEITSTAAVTSRCLPAASTPDMRKVYQGNNIYFGDLHTHSSISNDVVDRQKGLSTPLRHFSYARYGAALDFCALTDHHQPWDIERNKIGEKGWETICSAVKKNNQPGEFLAFAGFEYRCPRGDTAIVLNEPFSYYEIDDPEMKGIKDLWKKFRSRDYLSIPHFHNSGNLAVSEWYECPYSQIEPVLEINSCHGSYEREGVLECGLSLSRPFRPDRTAAWFLQNNFKYGLVCNSDGHIGNPGSNGLMAVYAEELSAEAIFTAIRKRQVYGTTNARIKLLFTINGNLMGSCLAPAPEKNVHISLQGERQFKAVDLYKNAVLYKRFKPYTEIFQTDIIVHDQEAANWYVRAVQLDNQTAYASPIWI